MRLAFFLLVTMVLLVGTLDAASVAPLSKSRTTNVVNPANVDDIVGNHRRFLRKHKVVEDGDEEEEERGFGDWTSYATALKDGTWLLTKYKVKNWDEAIAKMKEIDNADEFFVFFDKVKSLIKVKIPDYEEAMKSGKFIDDVLASKNLSGDEKNVLVVAYTKYQHYSLMN